MSGSLNVVRVLIGSTCDHLCNIVSVCWRKNMIPVRSVIELLESNNINGIISKDIWIQVA